MDWPLLLWTSKRCLNMLKDPYILGRKTHTQHTWVEGSVGAMRYCRCTLPTWRLVHQSSSCWFISPLTEQVLTSTLWAARELLIAPWRLGLHLTLHPYTSHRVHRSHERLRSHTKSAPWDVSKPMSSSEYTERKPNYRHLHGIFPSRVICSRIQKFSAKALINSSSIR